MKTNRKTERCTVSLEEVRRTGLRLLRLYLEASEEEKTPLLRSLAEAIVDVRALFVRADGTPDWKGRSYAYRVFVRDLYSEAGVGKEAQATIQAATRYHVGAVLRERLDDETLVEYALISRSPRERSRDRRESRTALLSALTARELHGGALLAISAAFTVLSKVEPEALDELDAREAGVASSTLRDLARRVNALARRLERRGDAEKG